MINGKESQGKLVISRNAYTSAMLFLYLCFPIFQVLFSKVFAFFGLGAYARFFLLLSIVLMFFVLCVYSRRLLIPDFWCLLAFVSLFFLCSYLLHPENEYWFARDDYGALAYVFRPDNGIYLYLLIRLVNDPKHILRTVKLSGWPMYLYYTRSLMQAISRGYWIDTSNQGYEIHMSYNLSLGYNVLLFALAFLFCALEDKKPLDWIGAAYGLGIILAGGSRGPFLDIGIFLLLYLLIKLSRSRKRGLLLAGLLVFAGAFIAAYPYLLLLASRLLERFHLSSRFLSMLARGTITEDSGRLEIWAAAWDMIKTKPWGYGAFGTRPVISKFIYVAHPHQVFLEILVDFGVVFGSAFIIWILYYSVKLFRMRGCDEWKGVFLVFFARACQLLVSVTFWHSIGLWGAMAVGVCMLLSKKRGSIVNGG